MLAKIAFWGSAKGGRTNPPLTGYRPHIKLNDVFTSCIVESTSGEEVFEFDKEHLVSIKLCFPETYGKYIHSGDTVNLFEASKQIGTGVIVDAS